MTRSIDLDPFDLTIEEKIFQIGKLICIFFAVAALSIGALDLLNVRAVETAAEFIRDSRLHYAELPDRILTGIRQISILPDRSSVTVAIPRDAVVDAPKIAVVRERAPTMAAAPERAPKIASVPAPRIAVAPRPTAPARVAAKSDSSPVDELAAARHLDAVEFAMVSPTAVEKPQAASFALATPAHAMPVPAVSAAAVPQAEPVKLASLDPGALPAATPAVLMTTPSIPLPAVISVIPPPAPGVPPPSPAQRLKLEGADYAKAERCLANAIYFESRSEPLRGQIAVAQVVINRVFSPFYPNDVCGVVYQNAHRRLSCQFTFACDGKSKAIHERGAWARANRIAKQALHGQIYLPDVGTSTHYHATYVNPYWVREMRKNVRYGIHNFYRPIAWGNGADEPVWARAAMASSKKK